MKCWRCGGTGSISKDFKNGLGWTTKICPVCNGSGSVKISADNILLLIDVQNGFRNEYTEPKIKEIHNFIYQYGFKKIIATKFINYEDSLFVTNLDYTDMMFSNEQEIVEEIKPFISAVSLKHTYNCVNSNFLEQLMILNDGQKPEQVLIAGFDTEGCVLASAIGLFDAGIIPMVLADFVASSQGEDNHNYGLEIMKTLFGQGSIVKLG